jgi:hypothetical protein
MVRLGLVLLLLASALPAGAGPATPAIADDADHPARFVGTWYQRKSDRDSIFYLEMTLFADGTYCEFYLSTEFDAPFDQTIGRWRFDGDELDYQVDRSTNPNQLEVPVGGRHSFGLGPVVSITHSRLRLGSQSPHIPNDSIYRRREPMRGKDVCRTAAASRDAGK